MLQPETPTDSISDSNFRVQPGAKAGCHGQPEKTPFFPVDRGNQIFVPWKRSSAAIAFRS